MEAHKLKKMMLVSEPFYGHVWSFLRESNPSAAKLNLMYAFISVVKCGNLQLKR